MTGRVHHAVRLPMYDWPQVRAATEDLEAALQSALLDALELTPDRLRPWPEDMDLAEAWAHPDVLLTQTCGYPLTHALSGKVRLLGAPHYAAPDCDGPRYCSQIVVRRDSAFSKLEDLRGARAVFNSPDSQSGMNAFRHTVAGVAEEGRFFSEVTSSGGHLASLRAVAEGDADVAAIDAVCWHLACREMPELAGRLKPIARTGSVPVLPLITSSRFSDSEAGLITEVIEAVFAAPETQASRARLGIHGFSRLSTADYAGILRMEREAAELGYPALA
ncbi:phosphate/phosphite/phosphonate ABC transporter substrate-binding protein [Roseibium salinum]|uniref:PhnD/SsuA/transferrin family substrate-binding protein n=1 Tax=Roseibium salinum TaxID=1604349 RepID=A0ABT3R813_9HYPH|nr:PhnD/SsuA/transferrin family substrate-binding protein [Roseibium sp. DSM 29163]MCX2725451.1 PhnD/SsuA/transferrin family substrate-binding protein [Roseibium sp. DSM 29163]MDN3720745.1 PhnD/SsuA/transferrin family substrate-binding protein [Roseibium salinum]